MQVKRYKLPPKNADKGATVTYNLVGLSAYAVEDFEFRMNGITGYESSPDVILSGDQLTWKLSDFDLDETESMGLIVYHRGVKNYLALFPFINDQSLQQRMADFYRDAEACFDAACWLPFSLMCGGIFEGILINKNVSGRSFAAQISEAGSNNIIDPSTQQVMDRVRNYRNLVHAGKHALPYVSRQDAMEIRIVLDQLIESA